VRHIFIYFNTRNT